ncbi:MAG: (d)CMP kinase [Candidatus Omnitrophota bacterium]|nr:(d)CMP kinase [Candidatus Omnitrophota bacterium]
MVIAIDGPAGSGKSTIARLVADKLGFFYLDTGAMYRAFTLKAVEEKIDLENENALADLLYHTKIDLRKDEVMLDGRDVSRRIREPEITNKVFFVARAGSVRKRMVDLQRRFSGNNRGMVVEGRDIGTTVFPDADKKFYLDAEVKERAGRRYRQLLREHQKSPALKRLEQEILLRDKHDKTRKIAPLAMAEDAVRIDTTNLDINEVVNVVLSHLNTDDL